MITIVLMPVITPKMLHNDITVPLKYTCTPADIPGSTQRGRPEAQRSDAAARRAAPPPQSGGRSSSARGLTRRVRERGLGGRAFTRHLHYHNNKLPIARSQGLSQPDPDLDYVRFGQ